MSILIINLVSLNRVIVWRENSNRKEQKKLRASFFFQIIGCVRGVSHNGVTEIGPVAVHPDYQGQGYGKQLMDVAETKGKGDKCTVGIVSCRTDVIPFFERRGYMVRIVHVSHVCSIIESFLSLGLRSAYWFGSVTPDLSRFSAVSTT